MTPLRILLTVTLLALGGVGTGVAVYSLTKPGEGERASVRIVPLTIEALRLNIPAAYFRSGVLPRGGMMERADLVAEFPEMTPITGPLRKPEELQQPQRNVFIAIMRGDGVLDPSERPQELYGRFLEQDVWENPGGLMMRRFAADSPYGDEELFLAPPDGRRFAARCRKPVKAAEDIGESCLWRFRQSGADIQIRFSPDLLTQWALLEAGTRQRLSSWTAQ